MNESKETITGLPPMIDTHCHLDDHQFAADVDDVLAQSRSANVTQWVLIGYDPKRWISAIAFADSVDGMHHTVGVHPACAQEWTDHVGERLRELAMESGAVAIGESGLDFYRDNAPFDVQRRAFRSQLEIASQLALPLIIHLRDAEVEMLQVLESEPSLPELIFHSFDGTSALMDFALDRRSYVGIGGLATRQKSDALREQLARVPTDRILLETDSPYLVPARQKDRRNQPKHVATIAEMVAPHLNMTPQELAETSTANAYRVFGLEAS